MSTHPPLRAAVIGGGLMGALMDNPQTTPPLTHAGGFLHHPDYELVAICDPQPAASLADWPCKLYTQLEDLLSKEPLDIVSVAVPKEQQPAILSRLLEADLKAVIAEKPLAPTFIQTCILRDNYKAAGRPLLVNLSRRYSALYQQLAAKFHKGDEIVLCASLYYGKGLLHNGIHAIDLARMLFGEVLSAQPLSVWFDAFPEDGTMSAFLQLEHCRQFHLNALDERYFTCFELDIITNKARYIINNDHRTLHTSIVQNETGIPPGKRLVSHGSQSTDYTLSILSLLNNALAVIQGTAVPLCNADTLYNAQKIIEQLQQRSREDKLV